MRRSSVREHVGNELPIRVTAYDVERVEREVGGRVWKRVLGDEREYVQTYENERRVPERIAKMLSEKVHNQKIRTGSVTVNPFPRELRTVPNYVFYY